MAFLGHALRENRHSLLMDFTVSQATGTAERDAGPEFLDGVRERGYRPRTLGADRGYDTQDCIKDRSQRVTPCVTQKKHSAIDGRTTRHAGYAVSLRIRKRVEHFVFGIAHENLQQEADYRTLLQALFLLMAVRTQSEPSNWGGCSDHEVHIGNRMYVFEVKYNQSQDAALRQIRDRQYGGQHLGTGHTVTAVGLAFRRDLQTGPCLQVAQADLAQLLTAGSEEVPRARRRRYPPD